MDGLGEPWEVVYVNDGSRDDTLCGRCEALRERDPRVRGGQSVAQFRQGDRHDRRPRSRRAATR